MLSKTLNKRGTCPVCGVGCQVVTRLENGSPVAVRPDRNSPMPGDCARAGQALKYHDHPDRVNYPLKRVGRRGEGRWERISWKQAIDEIAAKLGAFATSLVPKRS